METIDQRINIAIAGGPSQGKSTLAAELFANLKVEGLDYDLITEESRKLSKEFGNCRTPFERLYLWRQQEREELRSTAKDGFVTDSPLFNQYANALYYSSEPRDRLAVRELFRMCQDVMDRYQIIVLPNNPSEIPYKNDQVRVVTENVAKKKHEIIETYVKHFLSDKTLYVKGDLDDRVEQVMNKMFEMRPASK
jgi:nicotinamide riboside kinase